MTTKHALTTPDGKRHTRTSARRSYTHAVIVSPPKVGALAEIARESEARARVEAGKYRVIAEAAERGDEFVVGARRVTSTLSRPVYTLAGHDVTTWAAKSLFGDETDLREDAHAEIASRYREFERSSIEAAEGYAAQVAEFEALPAETEFGAWEVHGWRSSAALAASAARGSYLVAHAARRGQRIEVVPVEIVD